jgi:UDP-N-acetylglucosamine acyltransferase
MIHSTALVHPEAQIAEDVEVGPWCVIGPKVKIGSGTQLKANVIIEGHTAIGEKNVIFPFAVIGGAPQDLKYAGEDTQLFIGDRNTIRESVTINRGTVQGGGVTSLGNDNLVMAYTHLGHDCRVGNHCVLSNSVNLAGHTLIGDYAILCGMTGVSQFLRVGAHSYVGGQSGVENEVPPYSIVVGSRPCRLKGANIVGLRRRGFPVEVIQKVNEAIKLWARPDVPKEQCLLEIESQYGEVKEIQEFLNFIRESASGVVR